MINTVEQPVVTIHTSPLPFKGFLFNNDAQINKQTSKEKIWFYFHEKKAVIGRFILHVNGDEARSPHRAPFGSFEFSRNVEFASIDFFIKEVLAYCLSKNIKTIQIVSYPFCYDQNNSTVLTSCLISNGFMVALSDLNFHLYVNQDFTSNLHESEKRRLLKAEKEGFTFSVLNKTYWDEMHQIIRICREKKGFPLSMEKKEMVEMLSEDPDSYIPFGVFAKGDLIAVSIGVKVNNEILYDFLPADVESFKNFSPSVFLKKNIMDYCFTNGFKIFDLGIATAQGIPNYGLIRFKENLGGEASLKLTFNKTF